MLFQQPYATSRLRVLPALFFFSGASSLIFETIFTRLLTYTFGNTAHAVSAVLAAFLGGLALGAFLLGRWVDRRPPSLWIYGVLELLVGIYGFFIPELFAWFSQVYVAIYHRFQLGPETLTMVRFGMAALVILVPTVFMGGTLPAAARLIAAGRKDFAPEVDRLYASNTLGAALGTLGSTYLLMPTFGVRGTIGIACGINLVIFLCVALLGTTVQSASTRKEESSAPSPSEVTPLAKFNWVLVLGAFLSGAVALAYEVIWSHILAFMIGNTVYAFGVMVATFLCGLGWGAHLVSRHLRHPTLWARALAACQFFLGLAVFVTLPLWSRVPDLFAQGLMKALEFDLVGVAFVLVLRMTFVAWKIYRRPAKGSIPWPRVCELAVEGVFLAGTLSLHTGFLWKYEATFFVAAEILRFFCAFFLLILPALLLGVSFPLLLNLSSRSPDRVGASVGGVYAANTVGAIVGSVLTGFSLLPRFGSLMTLRAAATVNLALGLSFALLLVPLTLARKLILAAVASSLTLLFWIGRGDWDARRMSRGSYVYFDAGWPIDRVLYLKEAVQGGLTSVVEVGPSRILLSNGKFQGNNSGEVGAQIRFAMIPVLFTQEFERALVIGLGTGNTLRTVSRFPFRNIDTVEIAPHIVEAARLWFEDVNGRVFDRDPRVKLSVADGRNFLLLSRDRYDLITIEITSIWISGEADLYNREFYELCRMRMKDRGVLQQWVQIHHMRTQDLLVILNTAAKVFAFVAFFVGPGQGVLIASASPLECDFPQIEKFDADPGVQEELTALGTPSMLALLGELMLYGDSLKQALSVLPRLGGRLPDFVSTDFRPYLEYQTPKGNTLPYDTVPLNMQFMQSMRPPLLPPELKIRNLPSENEKNLVLGYVATARGDVRRAVEYFRRVKGPGRVRAQAEIERIESAFRRHASANEE